MAAAGRAARELGARIRVVKKTSPEFAAEKAPPPCPSVMVDGAFLVQNGTVTFEELKAAIHSEGASGIAGMTLASPT